MDNRNKATRQDIKKIEIRRNTLPYIFTDVKEDIRSRKTVRELRAVKIEEKDKIDTTYRIINVE